jgi:hypothetical protein
MQKLIVKANTNRRKTIRPQIPIPHKKIESKHCRKQQGKEKESNVEEEQIKRKKKKTFNTISTRPRTLCGSTMFQIVFSRLEL